MFSPLLSKGTSVSRALLPHTVRQLSLSLQGTYFFSVNAFFMLSVLYHRKGPKSTDFLPFS